MNEALEQEFDFYRGAGRGEVLDQLAHLAAWARSLVMLTGPDGAGKTVLLEQVIARVEEGGHTTVVRPPVGFLSTGHELLRHVVADLGEKVPDGLDEAALLRLVLQHIVGELGHECATLLLLDDAHELSADVLRTLARLVDEAKDTRALNVLLAGEPSLPEQLRKATPARGNWHEIKLRPFALNDVRAFLRQRLPQSAAQLDAAGLSSLARRTGGWPGRVLAVFEGQPRKRRTARRRIPLVHAVWLLALVGALVAVVWMQRGPKAPEPPESQVQVEQLSLPQAEQPVQTAANGSGVRIGVPVPGAKPVDPRSLLPPSQQIPVPKPPDELTMPGPPAGPTIQVPAGAQAGAQSPAATRPGQLAAGATVAAVPAKPPTAVPGRIALPKPEPSPADVARATPASAAPATAAQRAVAARDATRVPAKPAATAAPASSPASPPARASEGGGADNGWLQAQPPANFTVQIMGVSAASAAQSYVRAHAGDGLRIVRTTRGGRDWYVVVKGSYRGRGEAQAAMKALSAGSAQPWVRTFDGIQRDASSN